MIQTDNLKLEKYELNDAANLADGYNKSMDILDDAYKANEDRFPISSKDIEDGGINTVDIANGAITENKLATAAVTADKLSEDAFAKIKEKIELNGRNFIILGDSYGGGYVSSGNYSDYGWMKYVKSKLSGFCNVYTNDSVQNVGNRGFAATAPWLTDLKAVYDNQIENPNEITDIVVLGGTNDAPYKDNVKSAIYEFATYAHEHFPNATVKIGILSANNTKMTELEPAYMACMEYGCVYIADTKGMLCLPQYIGSDNVHLTSDGYKFYAPYILNAVIDGNVWYCFEISQKVSEFISSSDFQVYNDGWLSFYVQPNEIKVNIRPASTSTPIRLRCLSNRTDEGVKTFNLTNKTPVLPYFNESILNATLIVNRVKINNQVQTLELPFPDAGAIYFSDTNKGVMAVNYPSPDNYERSDYWNVKIGIQNATIRQHALIK